MNSRAVETYETTSCSIVYIFKPPFPYNYHSFEIGIKLLLKINLVILTGPILEILVGIFSILLNFFLSEKANQFQVKSAELIFGTAH